MKVHDVVKIVLLATCSDTRPYDLKVGDTLQNLVVFDTTRDIYWAGDGKLVVGPKGSPTSHPPARWSQLYGLSECKFWPRSTLTITIYGADRCR